MLLLFFCFCSLLINCQVAEEKLEEHKRLNCPELRRLESRQMQRMVQNEWKTQQERKEQASMHIRL